MTTVTWIGGLSLHTDPNDATDPINWVGGAQPGAPGDVVIIPAGVSGSTVTLDLISAPGNVQSVDTLTVNANPFDLAFFSGVTVDSSTFTIANAASAAAAGIVKFGGSTITASSITAGTWDVVTLNDTTVVNSTISIANHGTLNLKGNTATSSAITQNNGNSAILQTGNNLVINAGGTVASDATTWLDVTGGNATINIGPLVNNGTTQSVGSLFTTTSAILDIGEAVTINQDNKTGTRYGNNGYFLIDGDPGAASLRLNARMAGVSGEFAIMGGAHSATLDVNTNMPGSQVINFGDTTGLLKIESNTTLGAFANVGTIATTVLQNVFARISGFKIGDTIDLAGVDAAGLTYAFGNDAEYGDNVLVINNGTSTIARLRIGGGSYVAGTGTADGSQTGSFHIASLGTTDTLITVVSQTAGTVTASGVTAEWNGVTTGTTTDWTAANWTGGSGPGGQPGQYQNVQITLSPAEAALAQSTLGNVPNYNLTVTTAQTVGSVDFDSPFTHLVVSAPLTLLTLPGQSNGAGFGANGGRLIITTGGTVTTSRMSVNANADVNIGIGGLLTIAGVRPFTLGSGLAGLDAQGSVQVAGGTIASGGNIAVGDNSAASVQVSNDITSTGTASTTYGTNGATVTATYTRIGGTSDQSNLTIQGPNTSYTDAGGDASTPFSGAMLVGGGGVQMNGLGQIQLAQGGNGQLSVMDGATLTDTSFAMIGASVGSTGTVDINNGGVWHIGTPTSTPGGALVIGDAIVGTQTLWPSLLPWLTVGANGTGTLNVNTSTLQLGAGEAFNTPKMMIGGLTPAATGFVNVQGTGASLDTGGGPLVVGFNATGTLNVNYGASVHVGAASATTGIGFGLGIGIGTASATSQVSLQGSSLTDDNDLVVAVSAAGQLSLSNAASLTVGGGLYIGGMRILNDGTSPISPTTLKGSSSGQVYIGNSTVSVAGGLLDIWQGSTLSLASGQLSLGAVTAASGELAIAGGATLQGAGMVSVISSTSILHNDGAIVAGGLTSNGNPSQTNTTLEIAAVIAGSGTLAISPTNTLQVDNSVASTNTVDFGAGNWSAAGTATLRDLAGQAFHATVADFYGLSEQIDFVGAGYLGGSPTYTANLDPTTGGAVSLNTTIGTITFHVTGYHPGGFNAASDGSGGTLITAADTAPCFAAGTSIATSRGEIPVESLRPGDRAILATGGEAEIVWLGHRRVACARHPRPQDIMPVRVHAHALAPGQPHRDLILSPDHALHVDGVLIPVRYLLNGATIVQETAEAITYWHVELERHGVLLAHGMPAESYLDTGNRDSFAGGTSQALHPDFARAIWSAQSCAPLVTAGAELEAAYSLFLEQAATLGHGWTTDPALVIDADGTPLAASVQDGLLHVILPPGTREARLRSRILTPAHSDITTNDWRQLGVAIAAIRLDGHDIALDDPRLATGWHDAEPGLRWTTGHATLDVSGAGSLALGLVPIGRYRIAPAFKATAFKATAAA